MWETNENGDICMRKVKHNKIRNTGLLYEFLLRQITLDVLKSDKVSRAVQIIKNRFNENTELGKELSLYNILIQKKFKSDRKADYFITEVLRQNPYLDINISAHDVAICKTLLKIARTKLGSRASDTYVDAAAYMAIAGECKEKEVK